MKVGELMSALQGFDREKDVFVALFTDKRTIERLVSDFKDDPTDKEFSIGDDVVGVSDNNGHAQLNVEFYWSDEEE